MHSVNRPYDLVGIVAYDARPEHFSHYIHHQVSNKKWCFSVMTVRLVALIFILLMTRDNLIGSVTPLAKVCPPVILFLLRTLT